MPGWFGKNEKQVSAKKIDSRELGRRAVKLANAEIEAFMQRLYSGVDKIRVFGDSENPDYPPLASARFALKTYLENLDSLLSPVLSQLREETAGWAKAMEEIGLSAWFELLIEDHYRKLKLALAHSAFRRLLDMLDDLEKADAEWRATNPEKAAEIPFDMYSTELDDALAPYLKEH